MFYPQMFADNPYMEKVSNETIFTSINVNQTEWILSKFQIAANWK